MEDSNNGRIFIEARPSMKIHKSSMIKNNNKLLNQGLETKDPLISKISQMIKCKRIVSTTSHKHLFELPTSWANNDFQKRKINRIKENIANNQKQTQLFDFNNQIKSNFNFQLDQSSRKNIWNFHSNQSKNQEFLTFEASQKEENPKSKVFNQVTLNFSDLLQQMRVKNTNYSPNKVAAGKITFKSLKIDQNNFTNNFICQNNKIRGLKLMKYGVNLGIINNSKNHLNVQRPETTVKVNSSKYLDGDRPLSRYNKNSLFSKIGSSINLKQEASFPIKNMNLDFGFENIQLLPTSWK